MHVGVLYEACVLWGGKRHFIRYVDSIVLNDTLQRIVVKVSPENTLMGCDFMLHEYVFAHDTECDIGCVFSFE